MAVDAPSAYRTLGYSRPVLKSIDANALTATAILTYPEVDYAGDYVVPDGGDWESEYKRNPQVNVEHRNRVGKGVVLLVPTNIDGQQHTLPLGTTHFDGKDRLSAQTFRLVADDVMTGVSLEFTPAAGAASFKSMGHPSPLEDRDAMRFERWIGLGWAHCLNPVNPNARTVLPGIEKAFRCVDTGRIGNELLDPILLKSLSVRLPTRPAQIVVPGTVVKSAEWSPMTPDVYARLPNGERVRVQDYQTTVEKTVQPEPLPPPSDFHPLAAVGYDVAQATADLANHIRKSVKYLEGKDHLLTLAEDLEAVGAEALAVGEYAADETTPAEEKAIDVKPLTITEGGLVVTKAVRTPRRFTFSGSQLKAVDDPDPDAAEVERILAEAAADTRAAKSSIRRVERTTRGWGR